MPIDPRTPVLIGYGQVNQRDDTEVPLEPVALMEVAARNAADPRVLRAVDAIRVVNLLSWRYRDPGLLLGGRIDAEKFTTEYSAVGGNTPQSLVNQACLDIQGGRADVVLLAGAETWRTRKRLKANGTRPEWPTQDESVAIPPGADGGYDMVDEAQKRVGVTTPLLVYPLFEEALRVAAGESSDEHRSRIGELWAQFNAVAQQNPHAWNRTPLTAEQIAQPGPDNRMVSWPYTKLLNSNNMVDQAAVLVLTSAGKADELQVPRDRWVFPWSGTDAHDTYSITERDDLHRSPAIRIAGQRALELAGIGVDEVEFVDIYSCFPSAVQVAAAELGLPTADPQRPLTVTGGLTFAGGPWNNYVMHSIATLAEKLIEQPGSRGLITANGGFLTSHSMGVYSATPPDHEFRWEDAQSAVDREPVRAAVADWSGTGTVESWTAPFSRDGVPEKAFIAVRTPDGARTLAVVEDPAEVADAVAGDIAGAKVDVRADGTATLR